MKVQPERRQPKATGDTPQSAVDSERKPAKLRSLRYSLTRYFTSYVEWLDQNHPVVMDLLSLIWAFAASPVMMIIVVLFSIYFL